MNNLQAIVVFEMGAYKKTEEMCKIKKVSLEMSFSLA